MRQHITPLALAGTILLTGGSAQAIAFAIGQPGGGAVAACAGTHWDIATQTCW
jgi:hypothetical protein